MPPPLPVRIGILSGDRFRESNVPAAANQIAFVPMTDIFEVVPQACAMHQHRRDPLGTPQAREDHADFFPAEDHG